ncbi:MAG: nucleotide pyrophosphohydrolase [Candidatus Aenigmatarchaeota archaeon]
MENEFYENYEEKSESEKENYEEEYVDFEKLKDKIRKFVRERDWEKYHNPKDLAIAIAVEAGELLEIFQWMKDSEAEKVKENKQLMEKIESELADVLNLCIRMADKLDLNLGRIVLNKLKEAERKYPKDKFKGVWSKPEY